MCRRCSLVRGTSVHFLQQDNLDLLPEISQCYSMLSCVMLRYSPHVDLSNQLCIVVVDLIFVHHPASMLRMFCHECSVIWAKLVFKLIVVVAAAHTKESHLQRTRIGSFLLDLAKDISWSPTLRRTMSSALLALPRDFIENWSHGLSSASPS